MQDRLTLERHELKYLVHPSVVPAIRQYLGAYMRLDRFTPLACIRYPITSLYYDSPDLRLARSTLDGECNRVKLRLRCYLPLGKADGETVVFFEIKRKNNCIVNKSRARTTLRQAAALMERKSGKSDRDIDDSLGRNRVVHEFVSLCRAYSARPVVNVHYEREAYESRFGDDLRITFDRALTTAPVMNEQWFQKAAARQVPLRGVVLEIKFSYRYPAWVADLVRRFDLERRSLAKYVLCAQTSGNSEFPDVHGIRRQGWEDYL